MTITSDDLAVTAVESGAGRKIEAESGSDLATLLDGDVVARLTKEAQAAGIPLSGEVAAQASDQDGARDGVAGEMAPVRERPAATWVRASQATRPTRTTIWRASTGRSTIARS